MNFVAAILYGTASSVLLAITLAALRGGLSHAAACVALGCGALVTGWTFWKTRRETSAEKPPHGWEFAAMALYTVASARAFLWLIFSDKDKLQVLSPNNLGDLSLHLTYIRYFANGAAFWPENPIFADGPLTYPIGVDLFNALLVLAGVDPLRGLIWVGLAGAILAGCALWKWGRGIALIAFLANGGLAGFGVFVSGRFVDFQAELAWKSIFLAIFVTQRGLLFALPAGLLLLASWRARLFHPADEKAWRLPLWGEVLLYASMPVFHLHTFLFFSLLLGSWWLLHAPARGPLMRVVGLSLAPATILVLLVTGMLKGARVLGWKPGWMWDDASWLSWCELHLPGPATFNAALLFWPVNFGFLLPIVALLAWRLFHDRHAVWARALFFPALFIFLLCCFVKFAPWEWDNTKIMLWSYLAIVPLAWNELFRGRPLWQCALAVFLLFWSGFATLIGGLNGAHKGHDIALRSELDGIAHGIRELPPHERFVAFPTYNHPLLLLGRKVALGYPGHVWSHGLPLTDTSDQVRGLMNGDDEWRVHAADLGVRYLFWGPQEIGEYTDSTQPWRDSAELVASGDWGQIYDLAIAAIEFTPDEPERPPDTSENASATR
ncbi:MAG: hypothetical protein JWQ44_893 [Chthoniobacter sp.]|nr:hypothetical protein [Chthoniobacter sp.]